MVKLNTDKAELEKIVQGLLERPGWYDDQADIAADKLVDAVHDALAAHEMKPEYDRMKANIEKMLVEMGKTLEAIQQYHEDDEEFCENIEKDFDRLKAILEGGE